MPTATRIRLWALLLCCAAALRLAAAAPADLDALIEQTRQTWQVPGVAVGIMRDGRVLLANGYGLRDVKRNLPVTARTVFATGSVTKSFTATIAAVLVDEGKLDWDRPVREYLPWFRLHDPVASELITMRDLLTHRSGVPRHDFLRFAVPLTRKELVERLRWLEPNKTFRSTYQYNNLMYVTAGYLEGELADSSWERLVKERILVPLEMHSSNTSVLDSQKSADYAMPYELEGGAPAQVPFYVYQEFGVGPNGAVNSTAEDMLKYVSFHMNGGKVGDKQLVSAAQMRQMHSPQMVAGGSPFSEIGPANYGLGWMVVTYRGHHMVHHGGAINGFRSWVGFLPHDRLAIVVLCNAGSNLPEALGFSLLDRLLGLQSIDWSGRMRARRPLPDATSDRKSDTRPSHPLRDYAGTYSHPAYGRMQVELDQETLKVVFPKLTLPLKHYHYDIFDARGMRVQFHMNTSGDIQSVSIPVETAAKPVLFTR